MAFKLTKAQIADREQLVTSLREKGEALNAAIVTFNETVAGQGEALTTAIQTYNEQLEEARSFVGTIAEDMRGEFDEKSEKWQEGDKGQEVQAWVEAWEGVDLEDVEVEIPEAIEEIDADEDAGALEELTESPE